MRSGATISPTRIALPRIKSSRITPARLTRGSSSSDAVVSKWPGSLLAAGHNSAAMTKIRAAVIGVGYLGRFHAQKYAQAADCELVAVADPRQQARDQTSNELGVRAVADYRELLGAVDAVSVVTQTPAHFAIARDFLNARAHVLVEKPITET